MAILLPNYKTSLPFFLAYLLFYCYKFEIVYVILIVITWENLVLIVIFMKILLELQLIYNTVLVSGVQQSESVVHVPISLFLFF